MTELFLINKSKFLFGFNEDAKVPSRHRREGDITPCSTEKKRSSSLKSASSSSKTGNTSEDWNTLFRPDAVLVHMKIPNSKSVRPTLSASSQTVSQKTVSHRKAITEMTTNEFSLEKLLNNIERGCGKSDTTSHTSGSKYPSQIKGLNVARSNSDANLPKTILGENTATGETATSLEKNSMDKFTISDATLPGLEPLPISEPLSVPATRPDSTPLSVSGPFLQSTTLPFPTTLPMPALLPVLASSPESAVVSDLTSMPVSSAFPVYVPVQEPAPLSVPAKLPVPSVVPYSASSPLNGSSHVSSVLTPPEPLPMPVRSAVPALISLPVPFPEPHSGAVLDHLQVDSFLPVTASLPVSPLGEDLYPLPYISVRKDLFADTVNIKYQHVIFELIMKYYNYS